MKKQKKVSQPVESEDNNQPVSPVIQKVRLKLTPAQAEFNRLNKKINTLKADISLIPEKERLIKKIYEEQAKPLFEKETAFKYDYLIYLDKVYQEGKLSKTDQTTLVDLFLDECEDVTNFMDEEHRAVMVPLVYKYEEIGYGLSHEEIVEEAVSDILVTIEVMGFKPNEAMKNAKTEDELLSAFSDYLSAEMENQERAESEKKAASKGKEKKLTKAELNQKLQEEQTLKSIREIYLELVKELHPDREKDETRRALKEERMKQLTEAYKQKDLASLLMMQVNWLEEQTSKAPQAQTDEVLKRYNKVLRAQLDRLEKEFFLMCQAPFAGVEGAYVQLRKVPLDTLDTHLKGLLSEQQELLQGVESFIRSISTLTGLRAFLKQYRKQQKERELYDDFFWGED